MALGEHVYEEQDGLEEVRKIPQGDSGASTSTCSRLNAAPLTRAGEHHREAEICTLAPTSRPPHLHDAAGSQRPKRTKRYRTR